MHDNLKTTNSTIFSCLVATMPRVQKAPFLTIRCIGVFVQSNVADKWVMPSLDAGAAATFVW
jgi:hypothetical protein